MMYSRIDLSLILTNGFGIFLVNGLNLWPSPPHNINTDRLFFIFDIFKAIEALL